MNVSQRRSSSGGPRNAVPSSPVLFDENEPRPYYGLLEVDDGVGRTAASPSSTEIGGPSPDATRRAMPEPSQPGPQVASNLECPVNKLPPDILLEIYGYFLLPPSRSKPWVPIMGVCRHWCAIIREAPSFWRDVFVTSTQSLQWFNLCLLRVKNLGLRIRLETDHDLQTIVPRLLEGADYTTNLFLSPDIGVADLRSLEALIHHPFPILDMLVIKSKRIIQPEGGTPHESLLWRFTRPRYPRLTALRCDNVEISWEPSLVVNLRTLFLHFGPRPSPNPLALSQFLDVLEHAHHMELLIFSGALSTLCTQSQTPELLPRRFVTLPKLRCLTCTDRTTSIIARFMSHVQVPAHCRVFLVAHIADDGSNPSQTCSSILPRSTAHLPIFRSPTEVTLLFARTSHVLEFRYATTGTPLQLRLGIQRRRPVPHWKQYCEQNIRAAISLFRRAGTPVTAVTILLEGPASDTSRAIWDELFDNLPELRSIRVEVCSKPAGAIVSPFPTHITDSLGSEVLAPTLSDGGRQPVLRVRCPRLTSLMIAGWVWRDSTAAEAALRCLQNRTALGAPNLASLILNAHQITDLGPDTESVPLSTWGAYVPLLKGMVGLFRTSH